MPGGFPAADRVANSIQIRATESTFATLEADPAALVGPLLGGGELSIEVPASCGSDPEICCSGGTPDATCGPVNIDLVEQAGDDPRLEVQPVQGQQRIDVVIRARLATAAPIPVSYLGIACDIGIDTVGGATDDLVLSMEVNLPQDPDEDTTRIEVNNSDVALEDGDVDVGGNILCSSVGNALKGIIIGLLTDTINEAVADTLSNQGCVACESGTTMECGAFANACTDNVCMIDDRCEQRIGIAGRMAASALLGGSGQLGSMDLFDVAGGYTETDNEGLSIGMYSGAKPFAQPRDRCGPAATAPVISPIAASPFFQGNTRPDTNETFGVGIGIHQQVLDHLAYAAYESGALCMNIGPSTVDLLHTDGLSPLIMPSIVDLLHGVNSPIILGLRPQSPPSIAIGPGTTKLDESGETVIDEPLLDLRFDDLEIDFFVMLDDQFIRVMTLSADIHLPLNLEVNGMGEIEPVLGDVDNAITDTRVSNSEALRETDAELEEKIPVLLNLALPQLAGGLGSFALPELGGVALTIGPDGIGSIENNSFLAIFADLDLQPAMARVATRAEVLSQVSTDIPSVTLALGGDQEELEFSYQINGGLWSPYTPERVVTLTRESFWISGKHSIRVRARRQGQPRSTDMTPVELSATFFSTPGSLAFHGKASGDGCACNSSASQGGWLLSLLVLLFFATRSRRNLGSMVALVAVSALGGQACTCSSNTVDCPDGCLEGEVERGPIGRYNSLAAEDGRVVAAAYDEGLGDLVFVERDPEDGLFYRPIAGVPPDAPTYEPNTYRGGVAAAGPDVGIWTSIQLHAGLATIAYVDNDTGAVHLASEQSNGSFLTELVDGDTGLGGASYLSLSISSTGTPSIAYLVSAVPSSDTSGVLSELRVATRDGAWTQEVVDVGPISCGGFCGDSETCVQQDGYSECVAESSDCSAACEEDVEACVVGVCLPVIPAPEIHDIAEGVGLFASLLHLSNDTMVLGYYDRILGNVQVATSGGIGFANAASYEDPRLDTGMWLTMSADADDLVHLAFQDASGDRLMYASFEGGALSAPSFVDEGVREGDNRAHPVGASASIMVGGDRVPAIVYQDGLVSDVEIARYEQGSWQRSTLMSGARLDGFFISTASDGSDLWMSHYFYETSVIPAGELEINSIPQ
jgi:MYXO-CTERM domain-containing protein